MSMRFEFEAKLKRTDTNPEVVIFDAKTLTEDGTYPEVQLNQILGFLNDYCNVGKDEVKKYFKDL